MRLEYTNQVEFINRCTNEVQGMELSLFDIYQEIKRNTGKSGFFMAPYECPASLEPYYLETAQQRSGLLGKQLKPQSDNLMAVYERLKTCCQDLEIYFRLKTFEKDDFARALSIISDFQALLPDFKRAKSDYAEKLATAHRELNIRAAVTAYQTAEKNLRAILDLDKILLESLRCNFNPDVATSWPTSAIQQNINEISLLLVKIDATKPALDYPASHYYGAFLSCVRDFLQVKKDLVDGYTLDARKSDQHANEAYWQMLNHFNGCYVPFYNQFADAFPEKQKFPLKITQIVPVFDLVTQAESLPAGAGMFVDISYQTVDLVTRSNAIPPAVNDALNKYVDFIDESVRVTNNLLTGLQNSRLSQTAFPAGSTLYYYDDDHQLPRSLFQETVLANQNLPENTRESLKNQAEVLFRMMTEMDELREELLLFSRNKAWKTQGFVRVEAIRDRYILLFKTFDAYKERLYKDLEKIRAAWPAADKNNSWEKSYQSLRAVVRADQNILETAKTYFLKETDAPVFDLSTQEDAVVKSISDEFTNMKGIEKLGRSNGLCPYTPYEQIGEYSQTMQQYVSRYQKKKYHDFLYIYNDVVESYNRFIELSKAPFLKNTRQMELFLPVYPPETLPTQPQTAPKPESKPQPPIVETPVREKIVRDTVYIRDTVYLEKPPTVNATFYSLEGYAPNNLLLLLDVSNSMRAPERLPLLQSSIESLVRLLRPEDELSVVVFSGNARLELPPTSGRDKDVILKAIKALKPGGKTDFDAGLSLAYNVAQQHYKRPGNNRIIIATDGEFALSTQSSERIVQNAAAGITLSVFKFGQKPTPELKKVSDLGKGNLVSINAENAAIFMILEAKK
ncbi:MAG: VWA domain-containing protein [Bacteroidota bacterium]